MNYDSWKTGNWGDDIDDSFCSCKNCEKLQEQIEGVSHYFGGILKELYGKGELDLDLLRHNMEELGYCLKMDFDPYQINVEKKENKIVKIF